MTCVKHSGFVLMVMVAVLMFVASVGFAGAAAEAPIGGTGLLPGESPTPGTANHSLKMHSPPGAVSVHPESGESVQGGVYVINPAYGCVSVPQSDPGATVATALAIPATNIEIVILVEGEFCDETAGGGGGESSWNVHYNRDNDGLRLELSGDTYNDVLYVAKNGDQVVSVELLGQSGDDPQPYDVTVAKKAGSGGGVVGIAPSSFAMGQQGSTWVCYETTTFSGTTTGELTTEATATDVTTGELDVVVYEFELNVAHATRTLMTDNAFTVVTTPTGVPQELFDVEIRRDGNATRYSLGNVQNLSTYTQQVAGEFKLRCKVNNNSTTTVVSAEKDLEVQFPTASDILAGLGVQARMDQAWTATKNATTATQRREEGYYITLNTNTEAYGITAHTIGAMVNNNQGAGWSTATYPRPADSVANPTPIQRPTYTVGWFHTHTPTVNRAVGRGVGMSAADAGWSTNANINIPGFGYDYTESSAGSGTIPAGHPINSSAQVFTVTPPTRRPTP
jgi:hypothetical protein